jgi:toxin CcdB
MPITSATMQHDLFANPNRRNRLGFPLIVELQANVVDGAFRIVAPLTPITRDTPSNRLVPIIEHDGQKFAVLFNLVTNLSSRLLRHPVGSIAQYRDDLSRALDWLFFGI